MFYSIVIPEIRDIILQSEGFSSGYRYRRWWPRCSRSSTSTRRRWLHRTHGLNPGNLIKYDARIAAIDYTLAHDDGISLRNLDQAQVIPPRRLSRCGKTPTSLYLAMQYGIRAANYPFIADDMDNLVLPASLETPAA